MEKTKRYFQLAESMHEPCTAKNIQSEWVDALHNYGCFTKEKSTVFVYNHRRSLRKFGPDMNFFKNIPGARAIYNQIKNGKCKLFVFEGMTGI